jgi:hypothetical protein
VCARGAGVADRVTECGDAQLLSAGAGLLDATNVGANCIDMAEKNGHVALSKKLCELVQGKTLSESTSLYVTRQQRVFR